MTRNPETSHPDVRDSGPRLAGENDPQAEPLYDFAKQVLTRLAEVKSSSALGDVIQMQ